MRGKVYVLQFNGVVRSAYLNYEGARSEEDRMALVCRYNCVGRWKLTRDRTVWKSKWDDGETKREIMSFIYELEVQE